MRNRFHPLPARVGRLSEQRKTVVMLGVCNFSRSLQRFSKNLKNCLLPAWRVQRQWSATGSKTEVAEIWEGNFEINGADGRLKIILKSSKSGKGNLTRQISSETVQAEEYPGQDSFGEGAGTP